MRRTSLITILVFVAGLGVGYFARGAMGSFQQRYTHAADLAAIEKLHQEDIQATLTSDPKGLADIWAEDAVRFNPGGAPAVGKQAIEAENEKLRAQFPDFKTLSFAPKFKNIHIEDGSACEWAEIDSTYKISPDVLAASFHAKTLRVMKRQSDGSWKFALIILNQ
jgi:uncharacterized protein (TIGR02246 family)